MYSRASYAFERATTLWPQAPVAQPLQQLHAVMLEDALRREDVGQARRVAAQLDSDEASQRAEVLAQRSARRQREIVALREERERGNWALVVKPLAGSYLFSAWLGACATALSYAMRAQPYPRKVTVVALAWATVTLGSGAFAWLRLRRIRLSGYLVSPRAFGTWAAVGAAIVVNGFLGIYQHLQIFSDMEVSAGLLAVGFAAMAMQTRFWLLLPAAAWLLGALVLGMTGDRHNLLVFGALWVTTLGGVGWALRRGARLDPS